MVTVTSAQIDAWVATLLWPFLRILALVGTAPILHDRSVPARLKIGLAAALAVLVAPTLPPPAVGIASAYAPLAAAQQLLIGAALGFAMRIVFAAVELAGDQIGLQTGLAFAGFIDPQSGASAPLVGSFLGLLAALVYLSLDGHLQLVAILVESFSVWPVAPAATASIDAARLAGWGGELFRLGLQLAAPVAATMLLVNLALGVLARSAPQLNIFAVGFPATLLTGLALVAALLPLFGPALQRAIEGGLQLLLR
jgi:flagellar biosynthetic protein FliR